MPIRALYLYAEQIVEPLLLLYLYSSCAILQIYVSSALLIMRVIVGDVPNSGYMLRFTQEHACLRISAKPVDMSEDSIIDVASNFYF